MDAPLRSLPLFLALVACAPSEDPADDTDTDTVADTDTLPDTDDTPPEDTALALPEACDTDRPDGHCPGTDRCVAGHCEIALDPGDPVPLDLAPAWETFLGWAAPRDLHADARTRTWEDVDAAVDGALAEASTAFEAAWVLTSAVGSLHNGHTVLQPGALCTVDPGLAGGESTLGACVVEVDDALVVSEVAPESPFRVGDRLLALGGRAADRLVADRLAQPRCPLQASTHPGARARATASLLFRTEDVSAVVSRGGSRLTLALRVDGPRLACRGRVPPPTETDVGGGVRRTDLAGGVVMLHLPAMGSADGGGFTDTPTLEALRDALAGLDDDAPVILDVRGNRGGFPAVADALAGWFLDSPTLLRRCRLRTGDGVDDVGGPIDTTSTPDPTLHHIGPLAVLQDGTTHGAAELLPMWVHRTGRGLLVGAPSSGSPGSSWPRPGDALGGILDGRACTDADGRPLESHPPAVDVAVGHEAEAVSQGEDAMVEAARRALLDLP